MKTISAIFGGMASAIVITGIIVLMCVSMQSCSAPHWYKASGDGCQSSAGMSGFGNKR